MAPRLVLIVSQRDPSMTATTSGVLLAMVKAVHTAWWLVVEAAMAYVIYAGMRSRTDRRAAVAGAVVAAESLVFVASGARCPLTGLAESFGAERGSVTDIYLPRWLARNLPAIHVPLVAAAAVLHLRNLRRAGWAHSMRAR